MRTDSALVKFVVPGIGEIGLIRSDLMSRIPLKHSLGVILHYSAGLYLLIAVDTAQTDITGVKWLIFSSVSAVITIAADPD